MGGSYSEDPYRRNSPPRGRRYSGDEGPPFAFRPGPSRSRSPRRRVTEFGRGPGESYRPAYSAEIRAERYLNASPNAEQRNTQAAATASSPRYNYQSPISSAKAPEGVSASHVPNLNSINSTTMKPGAETVEDQDKTIKEIARLFQTISDEQIKSATLRIQQTAAQKEVERREKEWKSSKLIFEKHPSHEESQKKAREVAERRLKRINKEVESTDADIKLLVNQSASRLVPTIITSNSQNAITSQNRIKELERTVKQLQEQLQKQQAFVEKHVHACVTLEKDLAGVKTTLSNLSKPKIMEQRLDKFEHLSSRIDTQIRAITEKLDQHIKAVDGQTNVEELRQAMQNQIKKIDEIDQKLISVSQLSLDIVYLHLGDSHFIHNALPKSIGLKGRRCDRDFY